MLWQQFLWNTQKKNSKRPWVVSKSCWDVRKWIYCLLAWAHCEPRSPEAEALSLPCIWWRLSICKHQTSGGLPVFLSFLEKTYYLKCTLRLCLSRNWQAVSVRRAHHSSRLYTHAFQTYMCARVLWGPHESADADSGVRSEMLQL